MRAKLLLIVAVILGLITTFFFVKYMNQFEEVSTVNEDLVDVVVVRSEIKKNQIITRDMLALKQLPKLGLHPQAITNIDDVVGRFALTDMVEGEVLLPHRSVSVAAESKMVSRKIQEGQRGVSVEVNMVQSVSNLIEPEDYVDVFHTKPETSTEPAVTTLVLEKIRVLAVERRMVEEDSEHPYLEYYTVALEIKPEDRLKLVHANQTGAITLVLHSRQNAVEQKK